MAIPLTTLADLTAQGFDDVIDARAPSEWADDHLPGAWNLPVLDDAERARVGTIYKQESPFRARKIGAALVARNAARHIETALAEKDGGWRPLVYCWRGGQRSHSFATILAQIGWRVEVLEGGYKAWRKLVVDALYNTPVAAPLRVLDGNTGTAKTELLHLLAAQGHQVIDLEGLANHRGSLFGHRAGGQPSQKAFERELALALGALDPARPVVVEAESSRVGDIRLPPELWKAMCAASRITIAAPLDARARYLARAYGDLTADRAELAAVIERMRRLQPAETIARWQGLAAEGAFVDLARELMEQHYDPRYGKQRARTAGDAARVLQADDLGAEALADLAGRIAALL